MNNEYVTRAELGVLIDFLVPRGEPHACDGPSSLVRGRRDWLDRALAEARGPVDQQAHLFHGDAIRTEPASVHEEGVLMMVTRLGCGIPVSNEHCIAALRADLAALRAWSERAYRAMNEASGQFAGLCAIIRDYPRAPVSPKPPR